MLASQLMAPADSTIPDALAPVVAAFADTLGVAQAKPALATGVSQLDAWLPNHGLPRGALSEILTTSASHEGSLAFTTMLLPLIAGLTQSGQRVALIDPVGTFYPPAFAGVALDHLILLRPHRRSDALWAAQQCARSPAIALTVGAIPRLESRQGRALAVAAEGGGGACVILRGRGQRSAGASSATGASGATGATGAAGAALRLQVTPEMAESYADAQLKVELLRSRPVVMRTPLLLESEVAWDRRRRRN